MELGDVVDELHDDHGLADAGAAERADLAALQKGTDQVDDLDARGQHLRRRRLIDERGRRAVDRVVLLGRHRAALVDRVARDVEHAAHHARADRHRDRRAGVDRRDAAPETFGARHRDRAHPFVAQMLLHLERQLDGLLLHGVLDRQRVEDQRQLVGKLDVDDRSHDLHDLAGVHLFLLRAGPHPHARALTARYARLRAVIFLQLFFRGL